MQLSKKILVFGGALLSFGMGAAYAQNDTAPTGRGLGTILNRSASSGIPGPDTNAQVRGHGIQYHGGPIITGTKNVYYIWYGNWTGNTALTILPTLATGLSGSPYFNINTTYTDANAGIVSNSINLAGQMFDNYSHGTALSDSAIQQIVAAQNPTDTNGVYFVLTSADVNETSGFCTIYCGWHTHATINGKDIKYAFVGNADRCASACVTPEIRTLSPNNNVGADGMASVISHELEEAATDPDLNAWYDRSGAENADKCAWTFGQEYTTGNGSKANMNLGGKDFLIQQNWVNSGRGYCALSF
ncbi:MAG: hypothetical protein C5B51_30485 [Terriglobia bacterium]|nr:MAG: hypothetical protein C5B51_30485 [Terriglobia bacterium]